MLSESNEPLLEQVRGGRAAAHPDPRATPRSSRRPRRRLPSQTPDSPFADQWPHFVLCLTMQTPSSIARGTSSVAKAVAFTGAQPCPLLTVEPPLRGSGSAAT